MIRSRSCVVTMVLCLTLALSVICEAAIKESTIVTVGSEKITDADLIFMISGSVGDSGDGIRTAMALVQMSEGEKNKLVEQLTDELLFSLAARERKLDEDPDIMRMLRWQERQALAGVYLAKISEKWDMSESAVKKYFDSHPQEFTEAEAVKIKYIMLPKEFDTDKIYSELAAGRTLRQMAELHEIPNEQVGLETSDWMEKGLVKPEFESAFFSSDKRGLLEPIKDSMAVYVVEIIDRRPTRQLSWDEAQMEAKQRLHRYLLRREVETLKKSYSVTVDESAIKQIGNPDK